MNTSLPPITWEPTAHEIESAQMTTFMRWVAQRHGLVFENYRDLHNWSVTDVSAFWDSVREFFQIIGTGFDGGALPEVKMPGADWYPHATLNFAENILRWANNPDFASRTAIVEINELDQAQEISWSELLGQVGALSSELRNYGLGAGDVVAAVLPNLPEAIIGLLAAASIGAVWTVNSPDLSPDATLGRLTQLQPKVLLCTNGYRFNERDFDCTEKMATIIAGLPTVTNVIWIDGFRNGKIDGTIGSAKFSEIVKQPLQPEFVPLPFSHPLWVLFSSGTSGAPKGIVHGHGGITLESCKAFGLMNDVSDTDTFYVAANTSWMVWNTLVFALGAGAKIICYAGSPLLKSPDRQLRIIADQKVTFFATGAAYLTAVEKSGLVPSDYLDLSSLRSILSTGSPLPDSTWLWAHKALKEHMHLGSDSGGTDICSGFIGSNPLEPVHLGRLQGPTLGAAVRALDESGHRIFDELGEMVITQPMPSMPLYFWADTSGNLYREAYFEKFPHVWTHGDWVSELSSGEFIVHGRSDATLNRDGVRLGTAEIYAALTFMPQIKDSLVIGVEREDGPYFMPLFVQIADGYILDDSLKEDIIKMIRERASARHVPTEIIQTPSIPVTHAGKKIEIQLRKLFAGIDPKKAISMNSLANPEAVDWFITQASEFRNVSFK